MAEDDPDDLLLFREALKHSNAACELIAASSGSEIIDALAKLYPRKPDVVILDINMPGMNGLECLKEIRSNKLYRDIPVGMLSTSADAAYVDKAYKTGANFFAVKPPSYSVLVELIDRLVTRDWLADPARLPRESFVLWK